MYVFIYISHIREIFLILEFEIVINKKEIMIIIIKF